MKASAVRVDLGIQVANNFNFIKKVIPILRRNIAYLFYLKSTIHK